MRRKPLLLALVIVLVLAVVLTLFVVRRSQPEVTHFSPSGGALVSKGTSVKVLVFSKTGAFRHASIKDGIAALRKLADAHHIEMDFTEDSSVFSSATLPQYKAVIFLLTSGNILNDEQKQAFVQYIHAGGGYVGVHSASDTEHSWPWYGKLMGAFFRSHPSVTHATVDVVDRSHPSTSMLPVQWVRADEWYNFVTNPRANGVHVLMTLDEKTYKGGLMGADHPIAWYHAFEGGRAWYTAMGHTPESYSEPLFLAHLWGGIVYAAGLETT